MPQLLLELFSEEIPARMQAGAARDLERMAREGLARHALAFDELQTFAGPRRLTLIVEGLPAATPDRAEELKGPKASAPPEALEGFLRKTGLVREQLSERDGTFYAARSHTGRPTPEIAAEIVGEIMRAFPWPKSMRSGSSGFRWVRPLKRVLFLFDGQVVPFEINGLQAADLTEGHRFMGSKGAPFAVQAFDEYETRLKAEFVTVEALQRRQTIRDKGDAACAAHGLELVEDEGLLDEVAGLAEWPTPLVGDMDPTFLDLPPEVIKTSMRTHQKYFAVRPAGAGERGETALAPHFLVVANIEASDGGAEIRHGNAKVLAARLSDARFFWDEDRKPGAFERWNGKLKRVTFHAELGTMAERVERIAALAEEIAPAVGGDPKLAGVAARLAKADLASAMVGEFPELQGIMGGYYARRAPYAEHASAAELLHAAAPDGQENPLSAIGAARTAPEGQGAWWDGLSRRQVDEIADAVRDHYKPVGPNDSVPTAPLTVAVALADKLDTLVGFFAIDEKPTGSKDPYALRRAALGVSRLLLGSRHHLPLATIVRRSLGPVMSASHRISGWAFSTRIDFQARDWKDLLDVYAVDNDLAELIGFSSGVFANAAWSDPRPWREWFAEIERGILAFFADRLKVLLRDEGKRHDLVDAVFALGDDDLVRITDRVEALSAFLATEDGANLLAGYKRAVNILRAERKKHPEESYAPLPLDGGEAGRGGAAAERSTEGAGGASPIQSGDAAASTPIPGPSPIEGEGSEEALLQTLRSVAVAMEPLLAVEDFAGAMAQLARLREPVDAFFDKVLVNDPDAAVRMNRLRLLATIQATANQVADFSLVQG